MKMRPYHLMDMVLLSRHVITMVVRKYGAIILAPVNVSYCKQCTVRYPHHICNSQVGTAFRFQCQYRLREIKRETKDDPGISKSQGHLSLHVIFFCYALLPDSHALNSYLAQDRLGMRMGKGDLTRIMRVRTNANGSLMQSTGSGKSTNEVGIVLEIIAIDLQGDIAPHRLSRQLFYLLIQIRREIYVCRPHPY